MQILSYVGVVILALVIIIGGASVGLHYLGDQKIPPIKQQETIKEPTFETSKEFEESLNKFEKQVKEQTRLTRDQFVNGQPSWEEVFETTKRITELLWKKNPKMMEVYRRELKSGFFEQGIRVAYHVSRMELAMQNGWFDLAAKEKSLVSDAAFRFGKIAATSRHEFKEVDEFMLRTRTELQKYQIDENIINEVILPNMKAGWLSGSQPQAEPTVRVLP